MTDQEKIILNEEKLLFTEFPYSMYVDNIFDSNINLKRNVFHTTSLIFSNSNKHQLILNNFENIRFSHLEI